MSVRLRLTSKPLNWSGRKLKMMRTELIRALSDNGAPGASFEVLDLDGNVIDGDPVAGPVSVLDLQHKECGVHWYSEQFTPCPKCSTKRVYKRIVGRVPLPTGAEMNAPQPL